MLVRPDRCGNYPRHMCGRYASFLPAEAFARIFGTVNPLPNLAPTQDAAVVRRHPVTGGRHFDLLKWFAADRIRCCRVALERGFRPED